jgi:hypothetical protein
VDPPTTATSDSRLDEAIATAVPNTTEGGAGAPTLNGTSAHSRSFSYQQMQSMGLSKAIDEYHRLLETGAQINTPRIPGKPQSSFLSSTLKATVLRPLPTIARPETLIACVGTLWSLISFLIYFTSTITVPLIVWLALGPSTPIQVPKQLTQAIPALRNAQIQPPADYPVRFGIAFAALVALRAAEVAVSKRAQSRRDAAEAAITPERLESCYAGVRMSSSSTPSQDWTGVIKEVLTLSQQYEEKTTPVRTRADALAWLDRVAKEVGLTIPREAQYAPGTALKAVEQVRAMLVA